MCSRILHMLNQNKLQSTNLLAELEDGQSDGYDEREEGQLQRVPGLQTEDAEGQRDEGHGLEEDEHQDGDDDLLELGFAGFADGPRAILVELDVEAQFIAVEVPGADGDLGVGDGQLEGHVVGLDVVFDRVHEVARRTAGDVVASTILCHFNGF